MKVGKNTVEDAKYIIAMQSIYIHASESRVAIVIRYVRNKVRFLIFLD
jgi:hypothetical protein